MELETVVYKDLSFSVDPGTLKFEFQIGSNEVKTIHISNLKNRAQRVQIKPPTSKYFKVDYTSGDILMPGLSLPIRVTFAADEECNFTDEITIDCCGEKSIAVPLEAVPQRPRTDIPHQIQWGTLPLGVSTSHTITIYPEAGQEPTFFLVTLLGENSSAKDLNVCPLNGCLGPDDPPAMVVLTCTPTSYISVNCILQISIYPAKAFQYETRITWDCKPGVIRNNLMAKIVPMENMKKVLREVNKVAGQKTEDGFRSNTKLSYYDAIITRQVPHSTHHAIATLLSLEPAKERSQLDQLGPHGRYLDEDNDIYVYMQKEFKARGRRYQNDLDPILSNEKLLSDVEKSSGIVSPKGDLNNTKMIEPENVESLFEQVVPTYVRQRTVRDSIDDDDFDHPGVHNNETEWFVRYRILSKFIRTARDIVTKNRLLKVLNAMRNVNLVQDGIDPENSEPSSNLKNLEVKL